MSIVSKSVTHVRQATDLIDYLGEEIDPGKPYVGILVESRLLEQEQFENDPNPYDKWSCRVILEDGTGYFAFVADNPYIEKQASATFQPDTYVGKKVRVVLDDFHWEDSQERDLKSIEILQDSPTPRSPDSTTELAFPFSGCLDAALHPAAIAVKLTPAQIEAANQLVIDFWTFADSKQAHNQVHALTFLITNGVKALDEWTGPELVAVLLSFYGKTMTIPILLEKIAVTMEHIADIASKGVANV